jgi:osmotically-inducible protein OsmY
VNRFSFRLIGVAAALAGLAACNDPTPQADRSVPAAAPSPSSRSTNAAPAASSPAKLAADKDLSDKVKHAVEEPGGSYVEVAASDGVVTLSGAVELPADKHRIALAAMEVEGVRSVVNNLVAMRGS